ncbi:Hpt domain-containing protein [Planctomycetaceae bacterium SH139]
MDDIQDPELLAEFVSESLRGLQDIEQDLLSLESGGASDVELVNRIFRAVHSIKGTGSYMGLDNLVQVAHRGETLLDGIRSGTRQVTSEAVDAVLNANDALMAMLQTDDLGRDFDAAPVLSQLAQVLGESSPAPVAAAVKTDATVPDHHESHAVVESASAEPEMRAEPGGDYSEMVDPELLAEFVSEAVQGLQDVEQDLLSLEGAETIDSELVNRVFRAVHTIKGNAGYMGLENLVRVAHRAEALLDGLRDGSRQPSPEVTDAVLAAIDALNAMLAEADLGQSFDASTALAKLAHALGEASANQCAARGQLATLADWQRAAEISEGLFPAFALNVELSALHELIDSKEGILDGLNSLGKVLHASVPVEQLNSVESGPCTIFFETVLDADMLRSHFSLGEDQVIALADGPPAHLQAAVSGSPTRQATSDPPKVAHATAPKEAVREKQAEPSPAASKPVAAKPTPAKPTPTGGASGGGGAGASKGGAANADQTMRVPVRILHELLEWTGNMVMARNQLMNEFNFASSTAFQTLSQAISGVHETVIQTRMQTTGTLFERYRRVVRDLARKLGKEVSFHIVGGDLELDRTILESFADPLTHLVRNCMDHALETPQEREAAGKNRQGNIYLKSYIQSGEIILEVQDDGRGIHAEKVCEKAIEKGVITAEYAAGLTENEKVMLIFAAGFSTKDQASDVSGRGVGMDVVKNNIEGVGGALEVRTKVGEGATFAARLPLAKALVSSSLTAALIIEIDRERFAIPETAISEIIRYDDHTRSRMHRVDGRDVYQLRDQLVALVDLRDALAITKDETGSNQADNPEACLVIIQYRTHLFGCIVDQVKGMQEIIVRSTPRLLEGCTVFSGHTVLGDGRVALILDSNGIVNKLGLEFGEKKKPTRQRESVDRWDGKQESATQKMLLFNYAEREYFAIPLELVALIERLDTRDIKVVGENEFCQFKNETVSVMRLDKFLPISPLSPEHREYCLIRPAAVEYPIGLITGTDVSVLQVAETFETRLDDGNGVVGTFTHQDKLVMLLDLFSIFEKHAPEKLKAEESATDNAKILVAEDSLFFRKLISQYMSRPEWDIEIVNDGLEAWERLQQEPTRFNLVISDINMPRMDGFELASRIRDDRRFDRLPLVALTTMSDDHFRQKGLDLGFDRYVIKIDKREVRGTVAECLKIRR